MSEGREEAGDLKGSSYNLSVGPIMDCLVLTMNVKQRKMMPNKVSL